MIPPRRQPLVLTDRWTYGASGARFLLGGHLVEQAAKAAVDGTAHPHPLAVSSHFLHAPSPGPAELAVEPLRAGRSTATTRVTLLQDDRACLDVVVTAGVLGQPGEPVYADGAPPALPPVEQCERATTSPGPLRNGIIENLDVRFDPLRTPLTRSDRAEVMAWLRPADHERPVSATDLLLLLDALPPVTFPLHLPGWVPTVELTAHVRALPAPGWLRAVQRARLLADGWLDEDCEIWDSTGRLVGQARQLAAYRLPAAP